MFNMIKRWLIKGYSPVVLLRNDPEYAQEIAERVHQRMLDVTDSEKPAQRLVKIAAEEMREDIAIRNLREALAARERIHALPPYQRAIWLDHLEGLTYTQIAKKQGITKEAALRDIAHISAALRFQTMETLHEHRSESISRGPDNAPTGMRSSAPHMGPNGGVHHPGAPGRRVPGEPIKQ